MDYQCPSCRQTVRLPDDSAGKNVLCPKCAAVIAVSGGSFAPTQPSQPAPLPLGGDNPYSAPQSSYMPPTYATDSGGPIGNQPVDAGSVLNYAWKVWSENLGLLVGSTLVVFVISIALGGIQGGIQLMMIAQGMDRLVVESLSLVMNLLVNAVTTYIGIGQLQMMLRLIRRQPASLSDLFGGGSRFWPVIGASVLAGLAMLPIALVCLGPGLVVGQVALFAGILAFAVIAIVLTLMFWPFYYLVVDDKARVMESFSVAMTITRGNKGTTFVLWLAGMGIMILGFLAFCIGIIFAIPLVGVMMATAYLMMSGQLSTLPGATTNPAYGTR